MKSRSTAILLAILLGGLGIHRFYLDQPGKGILYLIFCWTFIPSIIALIDGIVWLSGSEESFNSIYNKGQSITDTHVRTDTNAADELEKLFALKERGILTDEEFQARKRSILS